MNRQIRLVAVGIMVLFLALFVNLNYLQVVHATALDHNPLNSRRITQAYDQPRGDIISADGVTLAQSVPSHDSFKYLRQYPTGSLFEPVTGYYSFTYGADGAERYYNSTLTGANAPVHFPHSLSGLKQLFTTSNHTQNIVLTLSDKIQKVAQQQLAGRTGSVVAVDPRTGGILAMYSNPTFNPNLLAGHDLAHVQANYQSILKEPGGPLSPGAYRQRWFPGSTFKIITSAAVYDHDPALATKTYPQLAALPLPQTTNLLHNYAGEVCGGQLLALFTVSCDTGFGQIGLDLGAQSLAAEARAFGFDQTPPIDLPFPAQSVFPPASSFSQNLPELAFSAIGQENVQATPLGMALATAAIADKGTIMTPHILHQVTDSQDQVVRTYHPHKWLQATSAATAAKVTTLMRSVVDSPNGTGAAARIPGVAVAAKTGTAQTGTAQIDAWFAAFAPASNPTVAVAVVVPDQPRGVQNQGGTIAAPIAKAVIEAALAASGPGGATTGSTPSSTSTTSVASTSQTGHPTTTAGAPTRPVTTTAGPTTTASSPTTAPATTTRPTPTTSAPTTTGSSTTATSPTSAANATDSTTRRARAGLAPGVPAGSVG